MSLTCHVPGLSPSPPQFARLFPSGRGTEQKRVTLLLKTAEQLAYLAKIYAPYTYYACR